MVNDYPEKTGRRISTQLIAQHAHEIGINNYMRHSLDALRAMRSTAWKKYRDAKPTAREKISAFLMQQASLCEEQGNNNLAKKIQEIDKCEKVRQSQKELQHAVKPRGQSQILHIKVSAGDRSHTVDKIIDQEEMEKLMMSNFKANFLEVHNTPMPHRPFTN